MDNIEEYYNLDSCIDWLIANNYRRVVLQLKLPDLKHSTRLIKFLQEKHTLKSGDLNDLLDIYITQSSTCCLDLLVTQHVSNLDAIIHLGQVCLSKPEIANPIHKPILFSFGNPSTCRTNFNQNLATVEEEIDKLRSDFSGRICVLYDTSCIDYANMLENLLTEKGIKQFVDVAKLNCPDSSSFTLQQHESKLIKNNQSLHSFGNHLLPRPMREYNSVVYIGSCPSISLTLECPSKFIRISFDSDVIVERVNTSRLLNRRMALVERLKDEEELKFGVIITNPLPDISSAIARLENYSKHRKHTLYFISMIQTIDECKIGNFDLCDAFIVINSCCCSTILESLVYNRPIINELEFKLVCGLEAEYGRVLWPGSSSHLSVEDLINKRKVSDVSLALIHTRNELLERCSQSRANKWSGLEYKPSSSNEDGESLAITDGLKGIASSYLSEPLEKISLNEGSKSGESSADIPSN